MARRRIQPPEIWRISILRNGNFPVDRVLFGRRSARQSRFQRSLMTIQQLTSRDNPVLKTIRLISSGSRRAPKGLVIAEGIRILEEVEGAGRRVETVVFSEDFGSAPRERALLDRWLFPPRNLRLYKTNDRLFQSISTVQAPQGAIALVEVPEMVLESIYPTSNSADSFCQRNQDPGNLGTLIRTAATATEWCAHPRALFLPGTRR